MTVMTKRALFAKWGLEKIRRNGPLLQQMNRLVDQAIESQRNWSAGRFDFTSENAWLYQTGNFQYVRELIITTPISAKMERQFENAIRIWSSASEEISMDGLGEPPAVFSTCRKVILRSPREYHPGLWDDADSSDPEIVRLIVGGTPPGQIDVCAWHIRDDTTNDGNWMVRYLRAFSENDEVRFITIHADGCPSSLRKLLGKHRVRLILSPSQSFSPISVEISVLRLLRTSQGILPF